MLGQVRRADQRAFEALLPSAGADPELDEALLRHTYRLDEDGHPELHAAGRRAAAALGLDVPIEYYQGEGSAAPNAMLLHQSAKAVILFEGPLLERLDGDELAAICGHELAHRLLWTLEDGAYLAVDRLLDAAAGDARTPAQYLETHRRWVMASELFADRGALVACGDLRTTVRALLKTQTGLASVDPEAYLRQADELDLSTGSRGTSHPEGVARAWALKNWLADEDVEILLTGPLDVDSPDLLDATVLRELSMDFAAQIAQTEGLRTDTVATYAAAFSDPPGPPAHPLRESGPGDPPAPLAHPLGQSGPGGAIMRFDEPLAVRPVDGAPIPRPRPLTPATMQYLCYLLLDLATADPETGDAGLIASMGIARKAGLTPYDDLADDELGWSDKRRAQLATAAEAIR